MIIGEEANKIMHEDIKDKLMDKSRAIRDLEERYNRLYHMTSFKEDNLLEF